MVNRFQPYYAKTQIKIYLCNLQQLILSWIQHSKAKPGFVTSEPVNDQLTLAEDEYFGSFCNCSPLLFLSEVISQWFSILVLRLKGTWVSALHQAPCGIWFMSHLDCHQPLSVAFYRETKYILFWFGNHELRLDRFQSEGKNVLLVIKGMWHFLPPINHRSVGFYEKLDVP